MGDGYNISAMFDPWVEQMGFPVIDVIEVDGNLLLTQSRFLNDPNIDPESPPSPHGSVTARVYHRTGLSPQGSVDPTVDIFA